MNKICTACFVLILILCGCVRDCEDKLLPIGLKPFLFKEGTYWVYSNVSNAGIDTIYVAKSFYILDSNALFQPVKCRGPYTSESYHMKLVKGGDTVHIEGKAMHLSAPTLNLRGYLFDPEITAGECSRYDDKLCHAGLTSLAVNGNNFNEVHQMNAQLYTTSGSIALPAKLYLVKNIGAVKIEIGNPVNSTWGLQNWFVVQ